MMRKIVIHIHNLAQNSNTRKLWNLWIRAQAHVLAWSILRVMTTFAWTRTQASKTPMSSLLWGLRQQGESWNNLTWPSLNQGPASPFSQHRSKSLKKCALMCIPKARRAWSRQKTWEEVPTIIKMKCLLVTKVCNQLSRKQRLPNFIRKRFLLIVHQGATSPKG